MKKRTRILLLLSGGIAAAVATSFALRDPGPNPSPTQKEFAVGQITDSGHMVFYPNGAGGFELKRDYAFMLINQDPNKEKNSPQPLYHFAINTAKRVIDETEWDKFKAHLDGLPKGTVIDRYVTCMAPQSYGLPPSIMEQFESYCQTRGLIIRDAFEGRSNVICTCGKH